MDEKRSVLSPSGTPLLALIAAALLAGGSYQPSYRTQSPPPRPMAWAPAESADSVPARLTEDPLEKPYEHFIGLRRKNAQAALPPGGVRLEVTEQHASKQPLLVLAVSLGGGAWPEAREQRVRTRHAVASAFLRNAASYVPDDSEHLRSFTVGPPDECWVVPYEWFRSRRGADWSGNGPAALVLWIDDSALGDTPLERVQEALRTATAPLDPGCKQVRYVWVGPGSSDGLSALFGEGRERGRMREDERFAELEILSPWSTARLPEFQSESGREISQRLERTIGFDDELARLLVDELGRRLPELIRREHSSAADGDGFRWSSLGWMLIDRLGLHRERRAQPRLAVVYEQDTDYGRYWLGDVDTELRRLGGKLGYGDGLRPEHFPYLSGIDGSTLGVAQAESERYPIGPSQVDYLERMCESMDRRDPFEVVFVLGGNLYDKLMILEALHASFPDTLLMTVDLDVRLLDPKHLHYTRNVLVASHLPLKDEASGVLFRDLYQHSTYRTVRHLLDGTFLPELERESSSSDPALYEIGLGTFHRLPDEPGRNFVAAAGQSAVLAATGQVVERLEALRDWIVGAGAALAAPSGASKSSPFGALGSRSVLALAGAVLVGLVVAGAVVVRRWRRSERAPRLRLTLRFAAVALAAWIVASLTWTGLGAVLDVDRSGCIEPVALMSGVSVWPTVILRAAATLFALLAAAAVFRRLHVAHGELLHSFHLQSRSSVAEAELEDGLDLGWLFGFDRRDEKSLVPVSALWLAIGRWTRPGAFGWARLLVYSLGFMLTLGGVFALESPSSPARGESAYLIERLSVLASSVAILMLIFLVIETQFLCAAIVARVADRKATRLPSLGVEHEQESTGLESKHAEQRLRIRLLEAITDATGGLVWYPVVAVCLLIVSRASLFDWFPWSSGLVLTFALFFLLILLCDLNMRRVADRTRAEAVRYYGSQRLKHAHEKVVSERIGIVEAEVKHLRGGVFSPMLQHSIVKSALAPLIAYASVRLVDTVRLAEWMRGL